MYFRTSFNQATTSHLKELQAASLQEQSADHPPRPGHSRNRARGGTGTHLNARLHRTAKKSPYGQPTEAPSFRRPYSSDHRSLARRVSSPICVGEATAPQKQVTNTPHPHDASHRLHPYRSLNLIHVKPCLTNFTACKNSLQDVVHVEALSRTFYFHFLHKYSLKISLFTFLFTYK